MNTSASDACRLRPEVRGLTLVYILVGPPVSSSNVLRYDRRAGWTIFTVVDLFIGVLLIDLMTTSVPEEKLQRVRIARNIGLRLLAASVIVLAAQIVHRHGGGH